MLQIINAILRKNVSILQILFFTFFFTKHLFLSVKMHKGVFVIYVCLQKTNKCLKVAIWWDALEIKLTFKEIKVDTSNRIGKKSATKCSSRVTCLTHVLSRNVSFRLLYFIKVKQVTRQNVFFLNNHQLVVLMCHVFTSSSLVFGVFHICGC